MTARPSRPLARLRRDESGAVSTELVLLTPLLILMLLFVVALGRLSGARLDVDGAAAQAARAASIARDPATATAMATQTASAALGSDHVTCGQLTVSTNTAQFTPGGSVAVTVTCVVGLSDLTGLRLPASESVSSTATSVIDTYRSISGGFSTTEGSSGSNPSMVSGT
ncbi:MAG: TadE/TadG family type IV pilus assembly protein [Acidimicrobiales bacterium]